MIDIFGNGVGKKIKSAALCAFWIEIVGGLIAAIVMFDSFLGDFASIFIYLGSIPVIWLSCLLLYGFGQLIENTQNQDADTIDTNNTKQDKETKTRQQANSSDFKVGVKVYSDATGAGVVTECDGVKMTITFVTGISKTYFIATSASQFTIIE